MRKLILYLVVPLFLFLFVSELTLLEWIRVAYPGGHPDPFAPYEAIMPGHWAGETEDNSCDLRMIYGGYVETVYCDIDYIESPFISVYSSVYEGRIIQTFFGANDLYFGDMLRHWGRPNAVLNGEHYSVAFWDNQGLYAIIDSGMPIERLSYMLPVERFTISLQTDDHS